MRKSLILDLLDNFSYFLCHCYKESNKEKSRKNNASALKAYAHPAVFPGPALMEYLFYFELTK
jgi:hypothetical protein